MPDRAEHQVFCEEIFDKFSIVDRLLSEAGKYRDRRDRHIYHHPM
jgi:hypothetical protein